MNNSATEQFDLEILPLEHSNLDQIYYQNIQTENFEIKNEQYVEEIQLNHSSSVKYLPYVIIPELDYAKFLIDTGATDSIICPEIANLYFSDYLIHHPFSIKTMHDTTYHRHIALTPALVSFKSSEKDFRWNILNFSDKFQGLIGSTMLMKLRAQIDYKNNLIHLPDTKIPFYYDKPRENVLNVISEILNRNIETKLQDNHLNNEERTLLRKLIYEYRDILYDENLALTFTSKIQHAIHLVDDIPVYQKPYRKSPKERAEIEKQVQKLLEQDIIIPSGSPYSAPVSLVPKKLDHSGIPKFRMVVNYMKLNDKTVDDKFPLPLITDILDQLGRSHYFSVLDLASGYHQLEVAEKDRHKTAFCTESGQYEFKRLPFGLKNAPATFQRCMNFIMRDLLKGTCLIYLDDIIVYSVSLQEHLDKLGKVFQRLREANLKISLDKCEFLKHSIKYLGYLVTNQGLRPDPDKVSAIQRIKLPTDQKQIKSFLGLIGYYRRFIPNFAKITKPMTECLKKGHKIDTSNGEYQRAFQTCKEILSNPPLLQYPEFNQQFTVTADASEYAIGAVLSQGPKGRDKPVCYASRTLSSTECKYSTIEKELLAIIYATKQFRPYLWGSKFILITDHKPLIWLHNLREPNAKLERWRFKLQEFQYEILHKPGKNNANADALSRLELNQISSNISVVANGPSDSASIRSNENEHPIAIPISESPINIQKNQIFIECHDGELKFRKEIKNKKTIFEVKINTQNQTNDLLMFIRSNLLDNKYFIHCSDPIYQTMSKLVIENLNNRVKFIRCTKTVQVINDKAQQMALIKKFHEANNHRGITETFNEIRRICYWPNYHHDVIQYINNCDLCQCNKYDRKPITTKLQVTEQAKGPLQRLHVDVFKIKNKIYVTIIDSFSKFAQAIEVLSKTPTEITKALIQYFSNYGKPEFIMFDNGMEFNNQIVKELLKLHKIEIHFTTANHPQSQGEIERFHSTLIEHIRLLGKEINFMRLAIMHYNNSINFITKFKPNELFFGHFQPLPLNENGEITSELLQRHKQDIQKVNEQISMKQQEHKIKTINKFNENKGTNHLHAGQQVYIKYPGKYSKTNAIAKGPYEIIEVLPNNKIKVKNKNNKLFVYHINSIKSIVSELPSSEAGNRN